MESEHTAEHARFRREASAGEEWKRFGPYLAERQWGTVREDYSKDGACWDYFPHDHARSRAYRWGEDGLLGFCDRDARLCFGIALWNGHDAILKERLFGVSAPEGNHGEDVKELYYYLDSTPTHSYFKAVYKYPMEAYPYERLVRENRERSILDPELEIEDTGAFDHGRYFDVTAEYAKAAPNDIAIRIEVANRSGERARIHVIPQLWFRNTWSWGREAQPEYGPKPRLWLGARRCVAVEHAALGRYLWEAGRSSSDVEPDMIFTENETNVERLFGAKNPTPFVKDAFHEYVVEGRDQRVNPENHGTKAGAHYELTIDGHSSVTLLLRLSSETDTQARLGLRHVEETLRERTAEADRFYAALLPPEITADEGLVLRQGYASLLWSKQAYHFNVAEWREGDPGQPTPPAERLKGRNSEWGHIRNHDILSVPDKWEYPWYAAWDLAFHMIPFAKLDLDFARHQLALFLSNRYIHRSGQLPAYEFAFGDVNPPVHAWACLRVFELSDRDDPHARAFLTIAFDRLVTNFDWWQRAEETGGNRLLDGGFLGLDNIGAFDRGVAPPMGGRLEQADGTGWMAFFALTMLAISIELGRREPSPYDGVAVRFFDQFVATSAAVNAADGSGLWDERDGLYYDHVNTAEGRTPLRIHSMVSLIPLFAVDVVDRASIRNLPRLKERVDAYVKANGSCARDSKVLLSVASLPQLHRILPRLLNETEFLAPTGIRSLSKFHQRQPYTLSVRDAEYRVDYAPEDSRTKAFGINSNWRGPVWLPLNYLLVEALKRHHEFHGAGVRAECPVGSGVSMSLREAALEIERRLASTFLADSSGRRPCHGDNRRYRVDRHFKNLVLFHEYFCGDTGRGFGASHQTGWTTLVLRCIEDVAKRRNLSTRNLS